MNAIKNTIYNIRNRIDYFLWINGEDLFWFIAFLVVGNILLVK